MKSMRICYLANAASVHTVRWVKYFIEKGHEVHIVSFEEATIKGATMHILKLPVLVKNATFALKLALVFQIYILLRRIKPDVVHAHYVTNYGLFSALSNCKPFVLTAWGSDILTVPGERFLSKIKRLISKLVLSRTDLVTCDAEHMKAALNQLGVQKNKIVLIFFGVDTKKFCPRQKSDVLEKKFGIGDAPVVISLRNLEPLYDVESLVKSIPLVLREVPKSKFIIAGRGSEEHRLKELAESLGVSSSVNFIGFVPNDELPQYLNSVDVYVSTSLSDAGIAASTAEAMACGLPVIVTDVADNRKWVTDGENGFVVLGKAPEILAEKIIYLLKNEHIRKHFGEANRHIIEERNNYYKEMKKMETLYTELIRRRRK
ncbi:glycosyltransferase [Candidatus Bathyarchaeota archaeon]|nr:glycosyltransferase [Candidatus Bathyarchaeota archaeon]